MQLVRRQPGLGLFDRAVIGAGRYAASELQKYGSRRLKEYGYKGVRYATDTVKQKVDRFKQLTAKRLEGNLYFCL